MKNLATYLTLFFIITSTSYALNLAIIGDSITAGYGVTKEEGYPHILEGLLKKHTAQNSLFAAGISGSTTASSLYRTKRLFKNQKPTHIMIALGGNDALRGLPPEGVAYNLQSTVDWIKKNHPSTIIIIAGMLAPPNQGEDYSRSFNKVFPEIAKKNEVLLLPFLLKGVAGESPLNQSDQIHPNAKGHQKIAQYIFQFLQPHL